MVAETFCIKHIFGASATVVLKTSGFRGLLGFWNFCTIFREVLLDKATFNSVIDQFLLKN